MKTFLKYFLIIVISFCFIACNSIKDPELVSVDNISISSIDDNSYSIITELKIYNPNKFTLQSKDIKLDLYMDSLFIGKIILMEDFYIKKLDTSSLKTQLLVKPKLFPYTISLNDKINLSAKGSAKIPILPIKHKFDIKYQLKLSSLINPLLKKNLSESDISFKSIKTENIRFSTVDFLSLFTFKNNFNFDYNIQKLDIEIFDSNNYENLIGKSSIKNPILVVKNTEVNVESTTSLNTAKLSTSILRNLLRKSHSLFIRANVIIIFKQIEVPLTILKQIDYNPLTQEIKIR